MSVGNLSFIISLKPIEVEIKKWLYAINGAQHYDKALEAVLSFLVCDDGQATCPINNLTEVLCTDPLLKEDEAWGVKEKLEELCYYSLYPTINHYFPDLDIADAIVNCDVALKMRPVNSLQITYREIKIPDMLGPQYIDPFAKEEEIPF